MSWIIYLYLHIHTDIWKPAHANGKYISIFTTWHYVLNQRNEFKVWIRCLYHPDSHPRGSTECHWINIFHGDCASYINTKKQMYNPVSKSVRMLCKLLSIPQPHACLWTTEPFQGCCFHTQSSYYHLLPINLFTCGMFQTSVLRAFHITLNILSSYPFQFCQNGFVNYNTLLYWLLHSVPTFWNQGCALYQSTVSNSWVDFVAVIL